MGTIADKLQRTLTSVNDIKVAIEEKGVEVNDAPLSQYADKIRTISGGGGADMSFFGGLIALGNGVNLNGATLNFYGSTIEHIGDADFYASRTSVDGLGQNDNLKSVGDIKYYMQSANYVTGGFGYCANLETVGDIAFVSQYNSSPNVVVNIGSWFEQCSKLRSVGNIDIYDNTNGTITRNSKLNLENLFSYCAIDRIPKSIFTLAPRIQYARDMFHYCKEIREDIEIELANIYDAGGMFSGVGSRKITLPMFGYNEYGGYGVNVSMMFQDCTELEEVYIDCTYGPKLGYFAQTFYGCRNLRVISGRADGGMGALGIVSSADIFVAFDGCYNLEEFWGLGDDMGGGGPTVSWSLKDSPKLSAVSVGNIMSGLPYVSGSPTLTFNAAVYNKVVNHWAYGAALDKGWNISFG